ncbi:MAG: HlyD family efflux transporter periplasmic adaptor subunit [Gammaproteobacteria bacterium]|nr:ABC transporter permease [Gammaproteobacteria bacterium]
MIPVSDASIGRRPVDGAMDRPITRRRSWPKLTLGAVTLIAGAGLACDAVRVGSVNAYTVETRQLTMATVRRAPFTDYVPIRGTVTPLTTVYLDAIEGGRVEAVLVEEGQFVEAGQPLLRLSNTALQLDVISREAQVSEQLNNLRNTQLALEQNRLSLKSSLVEIDYHIKRLTRLKERRAELVERCLITPQAYDEVADELEYYLHRRAVTIESQQADDRMRLAQIESLQETVEQLERNLTIARANLENLVIKAPTSGQLTALSAEVGESKGRGERLGQIDDVDRVKVTALIDEFYVTRIRAGQRAELELGGRIHDLEVVRKRREPRYSVTGGRVGSSSSGNRLGVSISENWS